MEKQKWFLNSHLSETFRRPEGWVAQWLRVHIAFADGQSSAPLPTSGGSHKREFLNVLVLIVKTAH